MQMIDARNERFISMVKTDV